jgi:hypothetical protein
MSDFIDDFLAGLEEDKQQPRSSNGLEKVLMSARDNQGTVVFAPFQDTYSKKFYLLIPYVKEYKTALPNYNEGKDEVWIKILPKEFYGDLTEAQSALYDEVVGLFDQVDDELGDIPNKWNMIRGRSYSLFQGVITNQLNAQGTKISDRIGKAALLIFPSRQPINELAAAIKNKIAGMNNSKEWIPAIFAPTDKGREGVVTITFTKPDAPGYDCTVGFEFNSPYAKVVDPQAGFSEEIVNSFGNVLESFLGWQNGKNGRFNEDNFNELKKVLTVRLNELTINKNKPAEAPIENKNGVDPMVGTTPTPAPEAPTSDGENTGTQVKLPF